MAFNFPATPTIGQIYTPQAGISYVWTGGQWDRISSPLVPTMPAGVLVPFAGATAPAGSLLCSGQAVDRVAFAILFAIIGTTYGVGDGTTTFNVPDMRGRVPFGRDNMGGSASNRLTLGISGIASGTLGAFGGTQYMHAHSHTGSGTSSGESTTHTHYLNLTSGGESVDHAHYVSGYTDPGGNHNHGMTYAPTGLTTGGAAMRVGGARSSHDSTTLDSGNLQFSMNFWSGGRNAGHTHGVAGSTGGQSVNHTHTYSFTTDAMSGTWGNSQNIPPALITNYIIFTGV